MIRKATVVLIGLAAILVGGPSTAPATDKLPIIRVGIVTDGPVLREESFVDLFTREMEGVTAGNYTIVFPDSAIVDGGWDPEEITTVMNGLLTRSDIDVILAAGVGVSAEICSRGTIDTPVVVPFAFGNCALSCSRLPNVSTRPINLGQLISRDLEAFHQLVPFHHLSVLMDPVWPSNCTESELARALAPHGVEVDFVPVPPGETNLTGLLPSETDAVYIMPLFQMDENHFGSMIGEITADGQFDIVSQTTEVPGDAWTDFLPESAVLVSDWQELGCGMYNTETESCVQLTSNY